MLISKFDLCKSEWLELVFAKRNKEYGAYYLRQHYADNIVKSMAITFLSVTALTFTCGMLMRHPADLIKITVVPLTPIVPTQPVEPKKEIQKPASPAPKQLVNMIKDATPVVTADIPKVEPPRQDLLREENVGPVDIKIPGGDKGGGIIDDGAGAGTGTAKTPEIVYSANDGLLEVMPEPYGGAAAWAKFLQKNLRYPHEASEKGISGKVWISFIIEKNGHLSSLVVERGAGYGMDEEALRVLKMAPPWKPGIQNGQPVRVKYTLPLNFVLDSN